MIAKIIAYGRTREEALARLRRAMSRDHRGDRGRRLQQELRARPAGPARGGRRHRRLGRHRLDRPGARRGPAGRPGALRRRARRRRRSRRTWTSCGSRSAGCSRPRTAAGRRPRTRRAAGRAQAARHDVPRVDRQHRPVALPGDASPPAAPSRRSRSSWTGSTSSTAGSSSAGARHHLVTATHGPSTLVEVDGVTHRVSRDEGGVLRSPAPALVVATPAPVGDEVEAGAPVLVLESMKMETVLHAPFAARVKELLVITGSQVETGAALVRLEPLGDGTEEAVVEQDGPALDLPEPAGWPAGRGARGAGRAPTCAACCSATTCRRRTRTAALSDYLAVRDELRARRRLGRWPTRWTLLRHLRRPGRAEPQPAGRRGAADRAPGAQLPGALPHLPAEPRRRARRAAGAVPRAAAARARATTASRTSSARPSWRRRSSGSSWPSSARPPRSRSRPPCWAAGSTSRRRPASWRRQVA